MSGSRPSPSVSRRMLLAAVLGVVVVVVLTSGMFAALATGTPGPRALPPATVAASRPQSSLSWTNLSGPSSPPGLAAGAAMAYDPTDGYLVLFGGCASGNFWYSVCAPTNVTWVYQNGSWTQIHPTVSPPARFYSSLTWDTGTGSLLLFGGNGSSAFLNDTWTFLGGQWSQVFPSMSPPARAAASMTYDSADGYVLLVDGEQFRNLTNLATETYVGADFNDSWTYSGGSWTQIHPSDNPSARDSASLSFDSSLGAAVLFGGFNWTTYNLQDTWLFSGGNWTMAPLGNSTSSSLPGDRNNAGLTYDPALGADVLFGGHTGYQFYSDTWTFNSSGWTPFANATGPSARWGNSLAYDPVSGCAILFGGYTANSATAFVPGQYLSDTWGFGRNCTVSNGTSGNGSSGNGSSGNGSAGNGSSGNGSAGNGSSGSGSSGNGSAGNDSPKIAAPVHVAPHHAARSGLGPSPPSGAGGGSGGTTSPARLTGGAGLASSGTDSSGIWISPVGFLLYVSLSVGILMFVLLARRWTGRTK